MLATIFSEFRKLFTVRSTYILTSIGLGIGGFLAFYAFGVKGGPVYSSETLLQTVYNALPMVTLWTGIVAILFVCHEYRYNIINYTVTASNSRLKVILSKMIVISGFGVFIAIVSTAFLLGLVLLGVAVAGNHLGPQQLDLFDLAWKVIAYTVAAELFALLLGFLVRNLVFAIVAYFLLPTIEGVLHQLLKVSSNYMPNMVLDQVFQTVPSPGIWSPIASLGMFGLYLVGILVVTSVLFIKRDAS